MAQIAATRIGAALPGPCRTCAGTLALARIDRTFCHAGQVFGWLQSTFPAPTQPTRRMDFSPVTQLSQSCDFYAAVMALPTDWFPLA
jgi:hypothetical protein